MSRRSEVLDLLQAVGLALDDDDIADRLSMNRHYVNQVCRKLAEDGVVRRTQGPAGKMVNQLVRDVQLGMPVPQPPPLMSRARTRRTDRARANVGALVDQFAECIDAFETSTAFPGPSLYFHKRALACRRGSPSAAALLADDQFLEYVYAVLPAWGMHRMGKQRAKVVDFDDFASSFRDATESIQQLWTRRITEVSTEDSRALGEEVWTVIASLKVSRSDTRIVAGSKALHHILPDLVPPIDRQYTFQFFTGQKSVNGDGAAFVEWFPHLCEIGRRCRPEIEATIDRGGFMATGPAKVIDNAIIGYMQRGSRP